MKVVKWKFYAGIFYSHLMSFYILDKSVKQKVSGGKYYSLLALFYILDKICKMESLQWMNIIQIRSGMTSARWGAFIRKDSRS